MSRKDQEKNPLSKAQGSPPPVSGDTDRNAAGFLCDLCGGSMLNRHCKLLCLRCGYQRDCSDP